MICGTPGLSVSSKIQFAEQVPGGTKLIGFTLMVDTSHADISILSAQDEQARYLRGHDGRWSKTMHKGRSSALVGEA